MTAVRKFVGGESGMMGKDCMGMRKGRRRVTRWGRKKGFGERKNIRERKGQWDDTVNEVMTRGGLRSGSLDGDNWIAQQRNKQ